MSTTPGMQNYLSQLEQLKAEGCQLVTLNCPCCERPIETAAAPPGETWDTLTDCPHCESVFLLITEGPRARGVRPTRQDGTARVRHRMRPDC